MSVPHDDSRFPPIGYPGYPVTAASQPPTYHAHGSDSHFYAHHESVAQHSMGHQVYASSSRPAYHPPTYHQQSQHYMHRTGPTDGYQQHGVGQHAQEYHRTYSYAPQLNWNTAQQDSSSSASSSPASPPLGFSTFSRPAETPTPESRAPKTYLGQTNNSGSTPSTNRFTGGPVKKFKCDFLHCTSSFSRKADRDRHLFCVHNKSTCPKKDCPVTSCSRRGDNGFTRSDHLTEHLRNFHHHDLPRKKRGRPSRASVAADRERERIGGCKAPTTVKLEPGLNSRL